MRRGRPRTSRVALYDAVCYGRIHQLSCAREHLRVKLGTHDEDIAKALVENVLGPSRSNESSVRDSHEQIAKRRRKEDARVVDNAKGQQ